MLNNNNINNGFFCSSFAIFRCCFIILVRMWIQRNFIFFFVFVPNLNDFSEFFLIGFYAAIECWMFCFRVAFGFWFLLLFQYISISRFACMVASADCWSWERETITFLLVLIYFMIGTGVFCCRTHTRYKITAKQMC